MSAYLLNVVAGRALLDEGFQRAMFGSQDRACLAEIPLTDEERVAILVTPLRNPDELIWTLWDYMCDAGRDAPAKSRPVADVRGNSRHPDVNYPLEPTGNWQGEREH